ncbi:MAG: hypothetical protein AB7I04_05670 [Pseudomonadales bacterium]
MSVEPFDPGAVALTLDTGVVAELLRAAGRLDAERFGLAPERVAALSGVARHDGKTDWQAATADLDSKDLIALIRLFTLAERLPGWESGARSPVIPMARLLKSRGDYPDDLTAWIKANTANRFLPYGSLLDRL